jgi:hypothetical protein
MVPNVVLSASYVEGFPAVTRHRSRQDQSMESPHNRIPVFLMREDCARWAGSKHTPIDLLRPFPAEKMKVWHVGDDVGSVGIAVGVSSPLPNVAPNDLTDSNNQHDRAVECPMLVALHEAST